MGQIVGCDTVETPEPAFETLMVIVHALDVKGFLFDPLACTGVEYFMFEVMLAGKGFKSQMAIGAKDNILVQQWQ